MAVRVAEVSDVPPLSGCCFLHDAATGRDGVSHDLVHGFARRDDEVERDTPESGGADVERIKTAAEARVRPRRTSPLSRA